MMHGHEKSDSAIVAVKPTNKAEHSAAEQSTAELFAAEPVEPRAETEGNVGQQSTSRAQSRISVSQLLARIRHIVAVDTRGGSRMRESCTYRSARGVRGNSRPYRPFSPTHLMYVARLAPSPRKLARFNVRLCIGLILAE